jgi:hypothetical protein
MPASTPRARALTAMDAELRTRHARCSRHSICLHLLRGQPGRTATFSAQSGDAYLASWPDWPGWPPVGAAPALAAPDLSGTVLPLIPVRRVAGSGRRR